MTMRARVSVALLLVAVAGVSCAHQRPQAGLPGVPLEQRIFIWAEGEPDDGPAPLAVEFDCDVMEEVRDPRFFWDFGDGSAESTEQNPKHVYDKPGQYTARVVLTDADGNAGEDVVQIWVEVPEATPTP